MVAQGTSVWWRPPEDFEDNTQAFPQKVKITCVVKGKYVYSYVVFVLEKNLLLRNSCTQFQKPTLNRGRLGDKFTALANARPVESVSYFVNDVTITLWTIAHASIPDWHKHKSVVASDGCRYKELKHQGGRSPWSKKGVTELVML